MGVLSARLRLSVDVESGLHRAGRTTTEQLLDDLDKGHRGETIFRRLDRTEQEEELL